MASPKSETKEFTQRLLGETSANFHIQAPAADIDIPSWVYTLPEQEYVDCTPISKSHMTCAFTHSPDGKRMSVNVEDIGGILIVEHYNEVIAEKLHLRCDSISDFIIGRTFTNGRVVWEVIATPGNGDDIEIINNVWVYTTPAFDTYMAFQRLEYEELRHSFQKAIEAHNAEETPYFAAGLARAALAKKNSN